MQRTLTGKLTKISSTDTIKVRVERKQRHPKYGKIVRSHKNYLVHAPVLDKLQLDIGDEILIGETRPISKNKKWEFINISKKFDEK